MLMRTSFTLAVAALVFISCNAESPALRVRSSFVKEDEKLNAVEGTNAESGVGQRRELWSWWSMLFLLGPHHCHEHGPLSHGPHGCNHGGSGGSSSGSDDGSSSTDDASSGDDATAAAASYVASSESVPSTNQATAVTGRSMSLWMLVVAGCAAAAALAAAAIGSRKEPKEAHLLEGSVKRRITLFSAFADSTLCGSNSRPDRVVEMTGDSPYRLA